MTSVLGFGTYDVRSHPRVKVLLDGLAAAGFSIKELNRPLGIGTAGRVGALKSPVKLVAFGATLFARWVQLAVGSLGHRGKRRPDFVLVGYMGHFDVLLARLLFPRASIILDHLIFASDTAKDRGSDAGIVQSILRGLDRAALKAASIIVLDTPAHRVLIPADLTSKLTVVVPVGAPSSWFDARRVDPWEVTAPLSVVFFGLYTPLQGAPVIAEGIRRAAEKTPLKTTMIGTGQDYEECRRILDRTDVEWIDWVESDVLPEVVAAHDVCLGILGTTPKALRVVPNKVYQGMASGCAVVTSRTQPQVDVLGDAVAYCEPGSSEDLAEVLVNLSTDRGHLADLRERAARRADSSFRADKVVSPLVQVMR